MGAYVKITETTLSSAAATITINSIPGTFTDLRLILRGVPLNTTGTYNQIRFNNDTGTNFSSTNLTGNGSAAASGRGVNRTNVWLNDTDSSGAFPYLITVDIFSYAGSTNKTFLAQASLDRNGGGTVASVAGLWRSTAAINRIDLINGAGNDYQPGTTVALYGIKES